MSKHKKKDGRRRHAPAPPPPRREVSAPAAGDVALPDAERDGWVRMTLSAELLEDAHPGSGAGGGGIDALVARDRNGRPVIWASHIEGVLRDAARRLHGEEVAGDVFGRAGGQRQRAVFTSLYADAVPVSRLWRSTARAAFDNRAPDDDTLRVVEHVPKGTRFEGQVELPRSDLPLLRRLLQEVDALGRGRATGAGRVKLSLAEHACPARAVGTANGRLRLLLCNLDPLCITATATPDNVIPSLAFIPGRALLGAVAAWLIGEGRRDAATLLVNGDVSVTDALPIPRVPDRLSAAEVLPAPLALQSPKPGGATGPAPWWAQARVAVPRRDGRAESEQGLKLKRPEPDLFVFRDSPAGSWIAHRPQLRVRLRNGRPDPGAPDPSLFAIEQIAERTLFLCELRAAPDDMRRLTHALGPVLGGRRWLRIGRAGSPVEVARLEWAGAPVAAPASPRAILTLTSDLLVRDEHLRWCTAIDDSLFQNLVGWPADVRVSRVIQDTVAVHGFNGTSRLWRMPASGIRRGSVFDVDGSGVPELWRMMAQERWLGERTHEGFGRFRLDSVLPGVADGASSPVPAAEPVAADDRDEAIAAATRRWCEDYSAPAETGRSPERKPSLSQWFDLVTDLERKGKEALKSRQNPRTAGGMSWAHRNAQAILRELDAIPREKDRISHARLFVRWLRVKMRRRSA